MICNVRIAFLIQDAGHPTLYCRKRRKGKFITSVFIASVFAARCAVGLRLAMVMTAPFRLSDKRPLKDLLARCILSVLMLLSFSGSVAAEEHTGFGADILLGCVDGKSKGRIYVAGERYRLETQDHGRAMHLIVDERSGKVHILEVAQKEYRQVDLRSRKGLDHNPIAVFMMTAAHYSRKKAEMETINGVPCAKLIFSSNGTPLMTAWISEKHDFPIKVFHHRFPEMFFELSNLEEWTVDPRLLEPPAEFAQAGTAGGSGGGPTPDMKADAWTARAKENVRAMIAEGKGFKLVVVDDGADGQPSKGRVTLVRKVPKPHDRLTLPFTIPNGRSFDIAYPAKAGIAAVEFYVEQGRIHINREKP